MKKLFVPYELALQLKEKGFDGECIGYYAYDYLNNKANALHLTDRPIKTTKFKQKYLGAPLYQQVIDFFREKHDIIIEIASYYNPQKLDKKLYECALSHKDNGFEGLMQNASNRISVDWTTNPEQYNLFDDYYKALSHIIQEALKLI